LEDGWTTEFDGLFREDKSSYPYRISNPDSSVSDPVDQWSSAWGLRGTIKHLTSIATQEPLEP
jgi:hypothetical protein